MANEFVAKNGLISQNNSVVNGSLTVIGNQTITGSLIQGLPGNIATGEQSHAEGSITKAIGDYSHAEGDNTRAKGNYSHAEGTETIASGSYSHAEGYSTIAIGMQSHAEGDNTRAIGDVSHAEGFQTISSGSHSHAEGKDTQAIGNYSHAEGDTTIARGIASHAEGLLTTALGLNSHAEGLLTTASANYSHAEGQQTQAIGEASHAEGLGTVASANYQHVQGQYNISSPVQSAFIIGNGVDVNNRSNLVFAAGSAFQVTGSLNVTAGITGSLQGTASWANNSTTASYVLNAVSSSFSATASLAPNYVLNSQTSSMTVLSSSFATTASFMTTSSLRNSGAPYVVYTNVTEELTNSTTSTNLFTSCSITIPDAEWPVGGLLKVTCLMDRTAGSGQSYQSIRVEGSTFRYLQINGLNQVNEFNIMRISASQLRYSYGASNSSATSYTAGNVVSITPTISGDILVEFGGFVAAGTTVALRWTKAIMIP